jgi:altronate hydrolase
MADLTPQGKPLLQVHPRDNVLVGLRDLDPGAEVTHEGETYVLPEGVRVKHKIVTRDLAPGDEVVMYGFLVGRATRPIARGAPLTPDNVAHAAADFGEAPGAYEWTPPDVSPWRDRHFLGFHRSDGRVGAANHWLVIPLVFCENRNVRVLEEALKKELGYTPPDAYRRQVARLVRRHRAGGPADPSGDEAETAPQRVFPNVDGIQFLTHEGGCGGLPEDARLLCALLAGYIDHPNVAGATILSLGCQNAQIETLREELERRSPAFDKPLLVFEQQTSASEREMLTRSLDQTFAGLAEANAVVRRPAPLSRLCLGMECGGSDGFSGLSANPAMGHAADLLVALGGQVILSEFPELCGVEQELIDRCVSPAVAERFAALMRDYEERARTVGSGLHRNLSAGNIRDGLLTEAMKSAGAARKGGTSPVTAVLDYGEGAIHPGLNLLRTPGNDVESTTGLAGAGATVIAFSTGMGTPTGNPIAPVIKVSSNTALAERLPDIIDLDAGPVLTGDETLEEVGRRLLEQVLSVASGGTEPAAVRLGQADFIPWKRGISL